MAAARTSTPATRSSSDVFSVTSWLRPPMLGTNSMPTGICQPSTRASCPAPLGMRSDGGAESAAALSMVATTRGSVGVDSRAATVRPADLGRCRRPPAAPAPPSGAVEALHHGVVDVAQLQSRSRRGPAPRCSLRAQRDAPDVPHRVGAAVLAESAPPPRGVAHQRRAGVRRSAIGVVPAWSARPMNDTTRRRIPVMPVTAPIRLPSASSRGPCSMWISTKASGAPDRAAPADGRRTRRRRGLLQAPARLGFGRRGSRRRKHAAERGAAERGEERALLVGERDHVHPALGAAALRVRARAPPAPPITPSAPSSQPPRGTVSLCEPSSTVRVAPGGARRRCRSRRSRCRARRRACDPPATRGRPGPRRRTPGARLPDRARRTWPARADRGRNLWVDARRSPDRPVVLPAGSPLCESTDPSTAVTHAETSAISLTPPLPKGPHGRAGSLDTPRQATPSFVRTEAPDPRPARDPREGDRLRHQQRHRDGALPRPGAGRARR